ncbi:MAG TPA: fibronectin type III domain-containing protein [Terriglobia bacterium]|jgi:hypothetical protein
MLRARLGFTRQSDGDIWIRGGAVLKGTYGSDKFPDPPVKQSDLKAALDDFTHARSQALDGGRKAFARKKSCRKKLCKLLIQLGHYVESVADNDIAAFIASGFEPAGKSGPTAPVVPRILKLTQGKSGELLAWYQAFYRRVVQYELRGGAQGRDGTPPNPWTISLTSKQARRPARIQNLTPGTIYSFQVRVYKNDETYSDWSNPVTRMCT